MNNQRHQLHVSVLVSSSLRLPGTVKQLSFSVSLISPGDRDQRQAEGVWSTWGRGEEKESNMSDFGKCSQNTPRASERKDGGWNWFVPDSLVCCLHTQTSPWETPWPSMAPSLALMTEIVKQEPLKEVKYVHMDNMGEMVSEWPFFIVFSRFLVSLVHTGQHIHDPFIMLSVVETSAQGQTHVRQIWGLCVVFVAILLTVAQKCHSACCSCPGEARTEFTEI